ncbi:MAG TPA: family 10 glycosylhydrolase, partial [Caproiciproducens sp.]|nr:family 10 glycosylhydrolase [Caproiciproducens sp.]
MILMVIRLFDRHSIFVCVCIMAVVIAITMAFNLGSKNRTAPTSESSQPVFSETESAGSASSFLSESFGNFSLPVSENAGASAAESSSGAAVSSQAAAVSAAVSGEMRAVWVPYMSLDMSHEADKSEKAFQKKFDAIIANAKKCNMNTLIVHVRPFGDALYKSSYYPWSHVVGGTQGVNPGYDPLAYMVSASHKAGLKIHAWINPLRVQIASTPSILAQENPYNTWIGDTSKTGWVVESGSGKYYNPAYTQVRRLIADGAKEIAKNYGVDGIQFDDYFYPTQDAAFDKTAYEDYCTSAQKSGTPLSLQEWRRANVNALVSLVYSEIKSV